MVGVPLLENPITIVDDEQFFFVIRTIGVFFNSEQFFLIKPDLGFSINIVDRLIVRTIKTLALIPNLTRDNKQKN
jgi:hypothetical protein